MFAKELIRYLPGNLPGSAQGVWQEAHTCILTAIPLGQRLVKESLFRTAQHAHNTISAQLPSRQVGYLLEHQVHVRVSDSGKVLAQTNKPVVNISQSNILWYQAQACRPIGVKSTVARISGASSSHSATDRHTRLAGYSEAGGHNSVVGKETACDPWERGALPLQGMQLICLQKSGDGRVTNGITTCSCLPACKDAYSSVSTCRQHETGT
eukprot:1153435-Pelagomonas_calceolata.AAC.7